MAKRDVNWTRTADLQFVGVLEYWVKRNKSKVYANKLIEVVAQRTSEIEKHPFTSKSTDFQGTRAASLGHFTIFYKITDREIFVTAFWGSR